MDGWMETARARACLALPSCPLVSKTHQALFLRQGAPPVLDDLFQDLCGGWACVRVSVATDRERVRVSKPSARAQVFGVRPCPLSPPVSPGGRRIWTAATPTAPGWRPPGTRPAGVPGPSSGRPRRRCAVGEGAGRGNERQKEGPRRKMRRQGSRAQRPAPRPPSSLASNPARGWACRPGPRISPRWTGRGQHAAVGAPGAVRVHGAPLARSRAPSLGTLGVVCAPPSPPRWSRPRKRRPPSRPAGPRPWAGRSRAGGPRARRRAGRRRPCCYLGDGRAEG